MAKQEKQPKAGKAAKASAAKNPHPPERLRSAYCSIVRQRILWKQQSAQALALQVQFPCQHAREIYTVLRSPNIDRKSREQFEIRTHKRLIDILNPTGKTIDALKTLTLPAGVDIKIKA